MARGLAVAVLVLCLIAAAPAGATHSVTTNCAGLQSELTNAHHGVTITLQGICTGQQFTLHNFGDPVSPFFTISTWTFKGDPSDGVDGFDGTGLNTSQRMLTGVDVHRLEIQDLVFRDGNVAGDGGALRRQRPVHARAPQLVLSSATTRPARAERCASFQTRLRSPVTTSARSG